MTRLMEMGANLTGDGCRFDVWSTNAVDVVVELIQDDRVSTHPMEACGDNHFRAEIAGVRAGDRYRFRLDGAGGLPDPYSRFQPEGVHGPSEVIDPSSFSWSDDGWSGLSAANLAIYELHVGTMTPEGTYAGLEAELEAIRDLGVTAIELMPVAQTPGTRNWGYDGVDLFAPNHVYGRPDDLRRLADAAHRVGLGVILDVVYNHLGPEGAYLSAYSDAYFSETHQTSWGAGLNWDGPHSHWVRQFAVDNACYWISEFHIDGLRLDATHAILDDSQKHIVQELTEAARDATGDREIVMIAEDERHDVTRVRLATRGGEGLDGVWADDFHHEVRVLLTNAHESYYALYDGTTEDIAHAVQNGFGLEQPEPEAQPDASDAASAFVFCIQNHDQIGNRPFGSRLHHEISEDRYRVASALLLFAPETPLLFMGQEFAASTPFLYFTDHPPELGKLVTEGRRKEFAGFRAFDDPRLRDTIPDPQAESTFLVSKLDLSERETNADVLELYRTLLRIRREDPVLTIQDFRRTDAFAPSAELVVVHRWNGIEHRVLVANFGHRTEMPATWLEAVEGGPGERWEMMLSTSEERFGGGGQRPEIDIGARSLTMPARTAAMFRFGHH
ncbi:MAG TPA: malto-oligosyltrehalose trehalohydrolase [Thermomicrobiales bacterium]|nr:malto-oligosyltrehalose trehalohydrolase [Thermomicrobiales bacterium]